MGVFDYSVADPAERRSLVCSWLGSLGRPPDRREASAAADYILGVSIPGTTLSERSEEYPVVTRGRGATHGKREVSYDALWEASESAGLYRPATDRLPSGYLEAKDSITEADLLELPALARNYEDVELLKAELGEAEGRRRMLVKRAIVERCRERYAMKVSHRGGVPRVSQGARPELPFSFGETRVDVGPDGMPVPHGGLSLMDPEHVRCLLANLPLLLEGAESDPESEASLAAYDLVGLLGRALSGEPLLADVLLANLSGASPEEVASMARERHGVDRGPQYFANLWSRRIPHVVARRAQEEYVARHHAEMGYPHWRICTRCGRCKPAHPLYFTRNSSTGDGYYSICKECRSKGGRRGKKEEGKQ